MKQQLIARWAILNKRYLALQPRERYLMLAAIVLVPLMLLNTLFLEPSQKRGRAAGQQLKSGEATRNELLQQVSVLQATLEKSPDAALKSELQQLSEARQLSDGLLSQLKDALVSPAQMNDLLDGVLARQAGLRLVSLRTLPPESLLEKSTEKGTEKAASNADKQAAEPGPATFDLYRHGVEIKLDGSFHDLQAYLVQLEEQGKRVLWGRLSFNVQAHPRARMTLVIYTLSTEKTWLTL